MYLQQYGYILIFKSTLEKPDGQIKGNVDAELVLHAMIEYPNYHQALIITGDGDFYCLFEYLYTNNKLFKIIVPNVKYSSLIRKFSNYIVNIQSFRHKLERKLNK